MVIFSVTAADWAMVVTIRRNKECDRRWLVLQCEPTVLNRYAAGTFLCIPWRPILASEATSRADDDLLPRTAIASSV